MRGLLYNSLIAERSFLIAEGIYFVCSAAVGSLIIIQQWLPFGAFVPMFILIPGIIPVNGLTRELEKHIGTRYAAYALSSVTRTTFGLAELVKNIALTLVGSAASMGLTLIFRAFDPTVISDDLAFRLLPCLPLIFGLIQWILLPLTIKLKSADKAGILFGLIFVLPTAAISSSNSSSLAHGVEWLDSVWFVPVVLCCVVLLYAIFWFVLAGTLKRGNIC